MKRFLAGVALAFAFVLLLNSSEALAATKYKFESTITIYDAHHKAIGSSKMVKSEILELNKAKTSICVKINDNLKAMLKYNAKTRYAIYWVVQTRRTEIIERGIGKFKYRIPGRLIHRIWRQKVSRLKLEQVDVSLDCNAAQSKFEQQNP